MHHALSCPHYRTSRIQTMHIRIPSFQAQKLVIYLRHWLQKINDRILAFYKKQSANNILPQINFVFAVLKRNLQYEIHTARLLFHFTFSNKENNCTDSKSSFEICNRDENSSSVTIQFAVFPVTMCCSIFVVSNLWF